MNLRKATYKNTSNAIQLLLNLSTLNGLLFVMTLFIAWDAMTNVIALFSTFIKGFERLAQGVPYVASTLCIAFSLVLAVVFGAGILVMNAQIPVYRSETKGYEIHKVAGYMSFISGLLSAFGYWDMVVGHYTSFESIPLSPSIIFHLFAVTGIAWITPKCYTAISRHIRLQLGDAILKFTDKVQDVARDVSIDAFEKEANSDKNRNMTLEERYQILKAS